MPLPGAAPRGSGLGAPRGASCPCRSVPAGAAVPVLLNKLLAAIACPPSAGWHGAGLRPPLVGRRISDLCPLCSALMMSCRCSLCCFLPPLTADLFPSTEFPPFRHPLSPIEALGAPVLEVPDGSWALGRAAHGRGGSKGAEKSQPTQPCCVSRYGSMKT